MFVHVPPQRLCACVYVSVCVSRAGMRYYGALGQPLCGRLFYTYYIIYCKMYWRNVACYYNNGKTTHFCEKITKIWGHW